MILCRVRAYCQDAIGIGNVIPMVGHGAPTECFRQTGDGGGMSYTGVVLSINQA